MPLPDVKSVTLGNIFDGVSFLSDVRPIEKPMFAAVSAVQDLPPKYQIAALMAAAKVLCDAVEYDPHKLLDQMDRAQSDLDSPFHHQWKALREYARNEFGVVGKVAPPPGHLTDL